MFRSNSLQTLAFTLVASATLALTSAHAHFPWLVRGQDGKASLYFGEDLTDTTYHLPEAVAAAELQRFAADGTWVDVPTEQVAGEDFVGLRSTEKVPADAQLVTQVVYGNYHGTLLKYYTLHQGGPLPSGHQAGGRWSSTLDLNAQVVKAAEGVDVLVTWRGKPLADAEVHLYCDEGHEEGLETTDASGKVSFSAAEVEPGTNAIMVGHTIEQAGTWKDEAYESASHYLTLTFSPDSAPSTTENASMAPLPFEITSFGAVRHGDAIYAYGGHTGSAHSYSVEEQSNQLLMLDLQNPAAGWKTIAEGPRLQGLGMVAHGDRLILIGGFTAKNEIGEDHDLHSQAQVTAYNLKTNQWEALPSLPEPRSSHDAALIDDVIYVAGGWNMAGEKPTQWHSTAWALDLSAEEPTWKALPEPPFTRRALATVAHDGKLFVIGGMNQQGGPTREVVVYDPAEEGWSKAGELMGESPMAGFGAAGWSVDGELIVTNYEGTIQRWDGVEQKWVRTGQTEDARFFHRVLPLDGGRLVSIGGANMEEGKFLQPETIQLD